MQAAMSSQISRELETLRVQMREDLAKEMLLMRQGFELANAKGDQVVHPQVTEEKSPLFGIEDGAAPVCEGEEQEACDQAEAPEDALSGVVAVP